MGYSIVNENERQNEKELLKERKLAAFKESLHTFEGKEYLKYTDAMQKYKKPRILYAQYSSLICFLHHTTTIMCLIILHAINNNFLSHWYKLTLSDTQTVAPEAFYVI